MSQLDYSAYVAIPGMRSESYQELESSGRLSLLRDTELRSAIASNLNDCRSTRPVLAEPIGDYRRILFETLRGRSSTAAFGCPGPNGACPRIDVRCTFDVDCTAAAVESICH